MKHSTLLKRMNISPDEWELYVRGLVDDWPDKSPQGNYGFGKHYYLKSITRTIINYTGFRMNQGIQVLCLLVIYLYNKRKHRPWNAKIFLHEGLFCDEVKNPKSQLLKVLYNILFFLYHRRQFWNMLIAEQEEFISRSRRLLTKKGLVRQLYPEMWGSANIICLTNEGKKICEKVINTCVDLMLHVIPINIKKN